MFSSLVIVAAIGCGDSDSLGQDEGNFTETASSRDAFSEESCSGAALDAEAVKTFFATDAISRELGAYSIHLRERSCEGDTCGDWADKAAPDQIPDGSSWNSQGTALLYATVSDSVRLHLRPDGCIKGLALDAGTVCDLSRDGATCQAGYAYYGDGDACENLQSDSGLAFTGVLTDSCLRLTASSTVDGREIEAAVLVQYQASASAE